MMRIMKLISVAALSLLLVVSCDEKWRKNVPVSDSGVQKVSASIEAGSDGMTTEQRNIVGRLKIDNTVGSIKHLYVISAYSGEVLIYSTVDGKVTSGGKRLTSPVEIKGNGYKREYYASHTVPRIQDDGTYGSSMNYLYWFDSKGVYHQHYVSGGQILHISDQPLNVKSITINMELTK